MGEGFEYERTHGGMGVMLLGVGEIVGREKRL